jgi:hypothetical protein
MSERHYYHRRLPCCGKKPKVDTPGNTTDCKCGFTYRAVEDGIWIKWERVVATPTAVQLTLEGAT